MLPIYINIYKLNIDKYKYIYIFIVQPGLVVQSDPKLLVLFTEASLEALLPFYQDPLRGLCSWWWGERRQAGWFQAILVSCKPMFNMCWCELDICDWDHAKVGWHPCQNHWGLMSPRGTCMCSWVRLGLPKGSRQDSNALTVNQELIHEY